MGKNSRRVYGLAKLEELARCPILSSIPDQILCPIPLQTKTTLTKSTSGPEKVWPNSKRPARDPASSSRVFVPGCTAGPEDNIEFLVLGGRSSQDWGARGLWTWGAWGGGNGFYWIPFYILFRLSSAQRGDFLIRAARPGRAPAQTPLLPSKVSWRTLSCLISWVLIFE